MATKVTTSETEFYNVVNYQIKSEGKRLQKMDIAADTMAAYLQPDNAFELPDQIIYVIDVQMVPVLKKLVPDATWF